MLQIHAAKLHYGRCAQRPPDRSIFENGRKLDRVLDFYLLIFVIVLSAGSVAFQLPILSL